jgi:hypothetical protein
VTDQPGVSCSRAENGQVLIPADQVSVLDNVLSTEG